MATGPDDVRFQGETGSSRPTSKVTRLTRNGRQADRVLLRIVSSFAPKAQYDGAERARHQVMATLRQFILGGATKSLIENHRFRSSFHNNDELVSAIIARQPY